MSHNTSSDNSESRRGLKSPSYFPCPNEIVDYWLSRLTSVELRVFLFINRKTLGWHKTRDRISISQLEEATGSSRTHITEATESLQKKGLITKEVIGPEGNQQTFYTLLFEDSNNSDQCPEVTPPQCPEVTPPSDLGSPTKDTLTKENKIVCGAVAPKKEFVNSEEDVSKQEIHAASTKCRNHQGKITEVTQSEIFRLSIQFHPNWMSDEILEAWDILVAHNGVVSDAFRFIEGTVEKIRNRKKSKYLDTKSSGKRPCQAKEHPPEKELIFPPSIDLTKGL